MLCNKKTFFNSVQVLSNLIEMRGPALAGHSRRVADVARHIAEKMQVPTVVTFSGCPGDSDDAKHPNWITTPWPPEFLEVLNKERK